MTPASAEISIFTPHETDLGNSFAAHSNSIAEEDRRNIEAEGTAATAESAGKAAASVDLGSSERHRMDRIAVAAAEAATSSAAVEQDSYIAAAEDNSKAATVPLRMHCCMVAVNTAVAGSHYGQVEASKHY